MAADNLGFDINLSDNEGADLLEAFYKQDDPSNDDNKDNNTDDDNDQDQDLDKDKDQNQTDNKNKDLDPNDLLALMEQQQSQDDTDKSKDQTKDKSVDNKDKNKDSGTPDSVFGILYNDFVERGLFSEVDNFDGTEEGFLKAYQDSLFQKAEELKEQEFEEIFSSHPKNMSIGKEFLSYLAKGGDPEEFINIHTEKEFTEDDLSKPEVQEQVVRDYLRLSGLSTEKINSKIEKLKALESLEEEAKDAFDVVKTKKETSKQALIQKAEADQVASKQRIEQFNTELINTINENTEIYGFQLGKDTKVKKETIDYMFKATEKTEDGRLVPKFAVDRQKVAKDPKWIAFQALALKNDLDFTKIFQSAETKVTSSLQKKLEGANEIRKNQSDSNGMNNNSSSTKKMGNLQELLDNTLLNR